MGALGDAIRVMNAMEVKEAIAKFADEYEENVNETGVIPQDGSVTGIKLSNTLNALINNNKILDDDYINYLTVAGSFTQNGAQPYLNGGKIPAGQSGNTAYRRYELDVQNLSAQAGETIVCYLVIQLSSNFVSQGKTFFSTTSDILYTDSTTVQQNNTEYIDIGNNKRLIITKYNVTKAVSKVRPVVQINNSVLVTEEVWFNLANIGVYVEGTDRTSTSNVKALKSILAKLKSGVTLDITALSNQLTPKINDNKLFFDYITSEWRTNPYNGATKDGNTINIPAGSTGQTSYVMARANMSSFTSYNILGKNVRFYVLLKHSNGLRIDKNMALNLNLIVGGTTTQYVGTNKVTTAISDTMTMFTIDYTVPTNANFLELWVNVSSSVSIANAHWFNVEEVKFNLLDSIDYFSQNQKILKNIYDGINSRLFPMEIDVPNSKLFMQYIISTLTRSAKNGAIALTKGISVPVGSTGQTSYVMAVTNLVEYTDSLIGKTLKIYFLVKHSNNLYTDKSVNFSLNVKKLDGTPLNNQGTNKTITSLSSNYTMHTIEYTVLEDDATIEVYTMLMSSTNTNAGTMELVDVKYITTSDTPYFSKNQYILDKLVESITSRVDNLEAAAGGITKVVLTVKPDGTGDFLSPKLANDSITDSSPAKWYEIICDPGIYTETEWIPKAYTIFRARNKDTCELRGELPDSATNSQITNTSTMWLRPTTELINWKITAKNMRYCVHDEQSGGNKDALHNLTNCELIHYGNQGARDWRIAQGGSNSDPNLDLRPNQVWASTFPWGMGTASGVYDKFNECTFIGYESFAWSSHSNKDFDRDQINEFNNCKFATRGDVGITVVSIGSNGAGTQNRSIFNGCSFTGGKVAFGQGVWLTTNPKNFYAGLEEQAFFTKCEPVAIDCQASARALKVESNSTGIISKIVIGGDAAPILFGEVIKKDGGGGLKGYVYGRWDVGGRLIGESSDIQVNNSLGRRLGDCSTINKTLTVAVDGGTPKTVTFNQNYTAISNNDILTAINTVLGADALASIYDCVSNEYYPQITDKELVLKNTGSVGIPRFSAVCYDTDFRKIRLMTTSDSADKFLGIALENIPPNAMGRILTEWMMLKTQMKGIESSTISFGNQVSLSSTIDGQFEISSTKPIGKVMGIDTIYFKGNKY